MLPPMIRSKLPQIIVALIMLGLGILWAVNIFSIDYTVLNSKESAQKQEQAQEQTPPQEQAKP